MTKPKVKTAYQLAEEHWNFLQSLLDEQRNIEGKLYKDAFIHGYKHGQNEVDQVSKINDMIKKTVIDYSKRIKENNE